MSNQKQVIYPSLTIVKQNIKSIREEDGMVYIVLKNGIMHILPPNYNIDLVELEPVDIEIGKFVDRFIPQSTNFDLYFPLNGGDSYFAKSFNTEDGTEMFHRIYAVEKHVRKNNLYDLYLQDGSKISTTEDHSLFYKDENGIIRTFSPKQAKPGMQVIVESEDPNNPSQVLTKELAFVTKIETNLPVDNYVYDISVEGDENFVCSSGIYAHNSPFTNVSIFDRPTLERVFDNHYFPDGTCAKDIEDVIIEVQNIFLKFMADKDPMTNLPYRFPVTTCNIFANGTLDYDFIDHVANYNQEGLFNIFITTDYAKIASCCRLINNVADLMQYKGIDSFGNGGINIGSHRVCTINLARLGRMSGGDKSLFKMHIADSFEDSVKILYAHRMLLRDKIEEGSLQFFDPLKWFDLDRMFYSTVGINGFYEGLRYMGYDLIENQDFAIEILNYLNSLAKDKIDQYSIPINIEQVPAEGAAIVSARKDAVFFGDNEHMLYANQFVPLWLDIDLFDRARIDGIMSKYFTGGMISHLNIGAPATKDQMKKLIQYAISCGLEHFALNPVFSVCPNRHSVLKKVEMCPICGEKVEDYITRVVGYFTPVSSWAKTRRTYEFPRRKFNYLD
jgi:hypothetical protein